MEIKSFKEFVAIYWIILVIVFAAVVVMLMILAQPPTVAGIGGRVTVDGMPIQNGSIIHVKNNNTGEIVNTTTENGWYAASMNVNEGDIIYVWLTYDSRTYSNHTTIDLSIATQFCNISIVTTTLTADAGGPYYGNEGEKIYVTGSGEGNITDWVWMCNGITKHGKSVYFVLNDGVYTATLTVYGGGQASDTATIHVKNLPPHADAGSMYFGKSGETIKFDGSKSSDYDNLTYRWDFNGDKRWDTEWLSSPYINHTYYKSGIYTVYVNVSDGDAYAIVSTLAVISGNAVEPSAEFMYETNGRNVTFNALGDASNYTWNFGDGSVGYGKNVVHEYEYGEYTVTLTVYADGVSNSSSHVVWINSSNAIECNFTIEGRMEEGKPVYFNATCNASNYTWLIDGEKIYGKNVIATFSAGNHYANLSVGNESKNETFYIENANVTLTVYVVDSHGKSISNATVQAGGHVAYSNDGVATLKLPKGNYTISVSKEGYKSVSKSISLNGNNSMDVVMKKEKHIPGFELAAIVVAVVVVSQYMKRR